MSTVLSIQLQKWQIDQFSLFVAMLFNIYFFNLLQAEIRGITTITTTVVINFFINKTQFF